MGGPAERPANGDEMRSLVPCIVAAALACLFLTQPVALAQETKEPAQAGEDVFGVQVGGRVHALWMLRDEEGKPGNEFRMNMVRLRLKYRASEMVEAAIEADMAEAVQGSSGGGNSLLRDAYVRVEPLKLLRFQAGQFKKPFSRIELRSKGKLETIERGISNNLLIADLLYGERDVGFMIDGRVGEKKKGTSYFLGVFNGAGKNADEEDLDGGKDIVGRVEVDPSKRLSLGLNGSLKLFDQDAVEQRPDKAWMAGADFRIKLGAFRLIGEGLYGENHDPCSNADLPGKCILDEEFLDPPMTWSAVLLATYKIPLHRGTPALTLEPLIKSEVLDPNLDLDSGRIYSVTPGANLHVGDFTRIMVNGDFVFPDDDASKQWNETSRLLLQVAFDL